MSRYPFHSNRGAPNTRDAQQWRPPFQPNFGRRGHSHCYQMNIRPNFRPQHPFFQNPRPDIPLREQHYTHKRGDFRRGRFRGNGRGGYRGGQGSEDAGIEAYYHPSMLEDPWKELEEDYWKKHPRNTCHDTV